MVNKKFLLMLSLSGVIAGATFAQILVKGNISDATTKEKLSYVNIGIRHKNIGTVSNIEGDFMISIPKENEQDTLIFSLVGYDDLKITVKNMPANGQVDLHKKVNELAEVSIKSPRLIEKKYGESSYHPLLHFTDGSTNQKDIFEIAQLIKLDTILSKVTSVNLFISLARKDSGIFRVNFYGFDGKHPTSRIVEKNITQTHAITPGWLKFDLNQYNIYLKGDFVIALEFIPASPNIGPINYDIKIVGATKSFMRASSQGDWKLPPHHYVLYVTALMDKK